MIHEGDIDLDPEYQRGQCYTLIFLLYVNLSLGRPHTHRRSMVRSQADGHHRFALPQLLRPTCRICHFKRPSRRLRNETMRRREAALDEYTEVL